MKVVIIGGVAAGASAAARLRRLDESAEIVLLEKGKVVNKWSANNLPDEYQLDGRLEDLPIGKMNTSSLTYKIIQVVAWFLMPLFLICIVDVLWERHSRKKITKDKTNNINPLMEIEK